MLLEEVFQIYEIAFSITPVLRTATNCGSSAIRNFRNTSKLYKRSRQKGKETLNNMQVCQMNFYVITEFSFPPALYMKVIVENVNVLLGMVNLDKML